MRNYILIISLIILSAGCDSNQKTEKVESDIIYSTLREDGFTDEEIDVEAVRENLETLDIDFDEYVESDPYKISVYCQEHNRFMDKIGDLEESLRKGVNEGSIPLELHQKVSEQEYALWEKYRIDTVKMGFYYPESYYKNLLDIYKEVLSHVEEASVEEQVSALGDLLIDVELKLKNNPSIPVKQ